MEKDALIGEIRQRFAADIESDAESLGDQVLIVRREGLRAVMSGLRAAPFDYAVLLDLTCVDFLALPRGTRRASRIRRGQPQWQT